MLVKKSLGSARALSIDRHKLFVRLKESPEHILQRILRFRRFFDLEIPVDILVYTEDEIEQALAEQNSFIRRALEEAVSL